MTPLVWTVASLWGTTLLALVYDTWQRVRRNEDKISEHGERIKGCEDDIQEERRLCEMRHSGCKCLHSVQLSRR